MKKLSLDLGALRVESFAATTRVAGSRGTVRGNDSRPPTFTEGETCAEPISGQPCVYTLLTACPPQCEV
ncbi:MAG TPA: hypothetical protein VHG91_13520 [Longimicrobium sp.]|nr:hypothetical protein [Longimicrobium sp.]